MKLLIISESPLVLSENRYFAVDTWLRFIQNLSQHAKATLWSPVRAAQKTDRLAEDYWPVKQGSLRIQHQDYYHSFVSYYRLWPARRKIWQREASRLLALHDVIVLRIPSPMLGMITREAAKLGKPLVLMVAGDIEAQSDRILSSRGLKRFFYKGLFKLFIAQERRCARQAALVYAYSGELEARHRQLGSRLRRFRTPHLSERDFIIREDSCVGPVIRLLRVSWLLPSKGLEYLFEAVASLQQDGLRVRLEIVGKERTPGYQAKLETAVARLGITEAVVFTGWLPFNRMSDVYARSDIQVISSLAEGTPRCMAEGFARGLPLVSTTGGGCADALIDGHNALVAPPANSAALAAAIKRVIQEPALRRHLIRNGYEAAREVTFEKLGLKFLEDLRQIAPTNACSPDHPVRVPFDMPESDGFNRP